MLFIWLLGALTDSAKAVATMTAVLIPDRPLSAP